ncbi:BnaA02g27110D [Brassica napus]|uniref:BnaA02g27110D protein n=1 Tax=Brassica napus TaxID=3708 RepID=A0A078HRC9_BRANA|nr:BnaA02g27110D [Brassica napus]
MSRLPVKALTRFQVVSKQWRRRIKSKYFMDRHMTITLTTMSLDWSSTSCLVQEGPAVYHIEPQIDQHARLSGSCDGLVCIFDENNLTSPIIVANPAMVRSQVLPLSQFQRQWKDDVTGTYKLVWLHNNQSNYTLSCEVFDFEVRKWRYVVVNTPSDDVPVFSKGWLYWIIANLTNYEYKILGYNIHTEIMFLSQGYFPPTSYICFLVGKGLGFGSAFTGLSNSIFIPYFQSLLSIVN